MKKRNGLVEGPMETLDAGVQTKPIEQEFITVDGVRYVRDKPVDGEVVKLDVGEFIQGILMDKFPSKKFKGKMIYKLKEKDDPVIKVMVGTTMLDKVMAVYEINDVVLIKRLEDIHTDNPNDMQQYVTYHPEEA